MRLTGWMQSSLSAALRQDGGDAERGLGLEMSGGLRVAMPGSRLRSEVSMHHLVMHAAEGRSEWGLSAAVQYGHSEGVGPTAQIRPVWGMAALNARGQQHVEVQIGYGSELLKGKGVVRPILAAALQW